MKTSQIVILTLSAVLIVSATQIPSAANASYLGTVADRLDSRIANADAGRMIARAPCDAKLHLEKDACVIRARAESVRLVVTAEASHPR